MFHFSPFFVLLFLSINPSVSFSSLYLFFRAPGKVAFKQVSASSVPHVSYLTWLDQYTLFASVLLIALYTYMALVEAPSPLCCWLLGLLWLNGNLAFVSRAEANAYTGGRCVSSQPEYPPEPQPRAWYDCH